MDLIRDVLDNQLVDRNQRKLGKVDGIVIELRDDQPPRVAYLEVGMPVLARRIHPRLGNWITTIQQRWGAQRSQPTRIAWSNVRDVGIDVEVDLEAKDIPVLAYENWLREHIISRIPGGS